VAGSKLTVIYNGIPLQPFLDVPAPPPRGPAVFGAVARLVPIKDHKTAIRAFSEVAREDPHCRLELAGDGPLLNELKDEAARLNLTGRVVFHGEIHDIPQFFRNVNVFLLSSLSEALPMSLIEAMAAARPVLSTAVGGVPEIVNAAHCGWLCPPGDPAAMAQAMRTAIQAGDHAGIGLNGRRFALEHLSAERMVQRYEDIFNRILT
jgi:glycosyltransferase involved in cell wall biosynthesis